MPTLIRQRGFDVMIHTKDHAPAHVHCYRGRRLVKVALNSMRVLTTRHATRRDILQAIRLVQENQERLVREWRRIHGQET